jgi:hypothetical protein
MPGCQGLPERACLDDLRAVEFDFPDFQVGDVAVTGLTLRLGEIANLMDQGGGIGFFTSTPGQVHAIVDGACMNESATWISLRLGVGGAFQPSSLAGFFTIHFDVPRRVRPSGIVEEFQLVLEGNLSAQTEEWHAAP